MVWEPVVWEFGEPALDQTIELATLTRRVTALALSLEQDDPALEVLLHQLRVAERALTDAVPSSPLPRVGRSLDIDGRVYLDHSYDIGAFNPAFPRYEIDIDGDQANGSVEFPLVYEGPPGIVHGGVLAAFFDCVIQHHNCAIGVTGETTALEVRFRRPTPLLAPLAFEIDRTIEGDRILSTARLSRDGKLCVEAQMRTVMGDRSRLPPWSPRRTES